ncbi:MAG: SpoIIE family protein phosphatase [Acidobacteria bacterium]|nr:SpoIIE family protein phosphatase [Acidobacteriota bacterium]
MLAALFATTAAYEVAYLRDVLRDERRDVAFFAMDSASDRVGFVTRDAINAGIRKGDEILSINGRPYGGVGDLGKALRATPVGGSVALVLRSPDRASPRTMQLPVRLRRASVWERVGEVTLYFFLPAVSVLLGFWVAVLRPRDPMAWLLLVLMLTFPHIFESFKVQGWPPGWREVAMLYHAGLGSLFPIVMFLFGRFFPEPFPMGSRLDKSWKWQQRLLVVPFAFVTFIGVIVAVGDLGHYHAMVGLEHAAHPLDHIAQFVAYWLIGSFFAAMATKYRLSTSNDAKRRLRILYWGSTVAWTPALLVTVYAWVIGKSVADVFPQWAILALLVLLIVFPLTLAYVIVVEKAMDVRVVLRHGLQYAFARTGIRVLQVVATSLVVLTALTLANHKTRNRPEKIAVIAIGVTAVFTIRRVGARLRAWTDRRFFREAYNAEHVLTELSEQVRTIVESKSLLETVTARIADTLHISRIAVLLGGDAYTPVYAMGYGDLPNVSFLSSAGTVKLLSKQKEPARVYLGNRDSWVNTDEDINDTERARLAQLGSELLLPLSVRDKLLGFISLGPKKSEEPYTGSDVRLLKSVAAQTGLALENANLMRAIAHEVAQRERLNREVEIAREVQERLFPQKLPVIQGLDYAGHCRPALGVGGDYYDFLALAEGRLGVAIGDVSGKGIAAALMMASLQASLRGEATRGPENLAAAVANINRLVYEASQANRYATFFYGQYDPDARSFAYVNAGHNAPMLFHCKNAARTLSRLEIGGTVVGLFENFPYKQGCATLAPGDLLVAFTDGVSEAMNHNEEEWGEERLIETVKQCRALDAKQILDGIFAAADQFVAGAKQHDDMTLVILRIKNGPV